MFRNDWFFWIVHSLYDGYFFLEIFLWVVHWQLCTHLHGYNRFIIIIQNMKCILMQFFVLNFSFKEKRFFSFHFSIWIYSIQFTLYRQHNLNLLCTIYDGHQYHFDCCCDSNWKLIRGDKANRYILLVW